MHGSTLFSNLDTFLVAIPFMVILLVGYFRLDEVFAAPKHPGKLRRPPCGIDKNGQVILTDPDGRQWSAVRSMR